MQRVAALAVSMHHAKRTRLNKLTPIMVPRQRAAYATEMGINATRSRNAANALPGPAAAAQAAPTSELQNQDENH